MGMVVIGAVFIDIKGYSTQTYIPAGRNVGNIETIHGGVARNVAEDIANVELKPTYVSVVDNTALGEEVISKLKDHKVNTDYIRKAENGMGTWLAVFNDKGDVEASISKRPDLTPIVDILEEQGDEIFQNADSICLEIDIDKKIVKKVFELAEKYEKDVYAVVSNMSIAAQRRDLIRKSSCFVCNIQEAGILFSEDYEGKTQKEMQTVLADRLKGAEIPRMVVTMGAKGAVYADREGECGFIPAIKVDVVDTTGAGDSFFSGVAIGLTYGKTMEEACRIGARLASTVISSYDNVCPRFLPAEFGIDQVQI